jgi:hypothetical protein
LQSLKSLRARIRLRTRWQAAQKTALVIYKLLRYETRLSLKYGVPFVHSFMSQQLPVEDGFPLLSLKALPFLESILSSQHTVFEYGSGGTTAFIAPRVQQHIFVENICDYRQKVMDTLHQKGITNVEGHCVEPVVLASGEQPAPLPGYPWVTYLSAHQFHQNLDFSPYVQFIDQFPDQHFDLVVVDGRARVSCVPHAIPKVKQGGYLMLDDSHRSIYAQAVAYLDSRFQAFHCTGLRPYHTMIHKPEAQQQRTSFWRIESFAASTSP